MLRPVLKTLPNYFNYNHLKSNRREQLFSRLVLPDSVKRAAGILNSASKRLIKSQQTKLLNLRKSSPKNKRHPKGERPCKWAMWASDTPTLPLGRTPGSRLEMHTPRPYPGHAEPDQIRLFNKIPGDSHASLAGECCPTTYVRPRTGSHLAPERRGGREGKELSVTGCKMSTEFPQLNLYNYELEWSFHSNPCHQAWRVNLLKFLCSSCHLLQKLTTRNPVITINVLLNEVMCYSLKLSILGRGQEALFQISKKFPDTSRSPENQWS